MMRVTWSSRTDSWLLGAVAFISRLAMVAWAWERVPPTADGKFYHVVAQRIATGEGYTWLWPDGAVTFAAHYPVGYPTLMALPYRLVGPEPGAMMLLNAVLGAFTVVVAHRLCLQAASDKFGAGRARLSAGVAGFLLAVSPTLVFYTPALMTEGAVAAFLVFSAGFALRVRSKDSIRGRTTALSLLSVSLGVAVLLRPQSVLFVPVLGYLSCSGGFRKRIVPAAFVSLGCLAVVLPWTLRNCDKMERCVFVSANGGWNLLIGTFPEGNGAWVALEGERVPEECRDVFQEAAKDECFGRAARREILERPFDWLALAPAKLRTTLDFTAAGADHLTESGALRSERKPWLSYPEFLFQRLGFLLVLAGAAVCARGARRPLPRVLILSLFACGALGFLGLGAQWGWGAAILLMLGAPRDLQQVQFGVGVFAAAATMIVHSVFFGAGRYSLPLIPLTAPLVAVGVGEVLTRLGYASSELGGAAKFDSDR